MDKKSLKQKILEAKDQSGISQYQIIDFLPDSMQTRNLICFVEDSKKKSYAIKFSTNKAIEKEYNIMKEIQHPNIIHPHHFIETNDFYGIVLPKAEGGDLLEQFSNSALLQSDIRHVMKSLFSALKFLHEYGIMHRDVKIENLLVMGKTVSSEIVLSDFEFATSDQFSKDLFGVPDFIAPEMYRGQTYDKKVDIWSAGVLMYLLCYLECPFDHRDSEYKLEFNVQPVYPISDEAKDLMRHLLCLNPSERFTADQALNHPWFSLDLMSEEVTKVATNIYENEINSIGSISNSDVDFN